MANSNAPAPKGASSSIAQQGVRYIIVGVCCAAIELAVFQGMYTLTSIGVEASNVVAIFTSTAVNFVLGRNFTFKSTGNPVRSLVLYLILFAFNTVFTTLAMGFLVNTLGFNSVLSKMATMVCVTLWNFVLYRTVIFK